MLPVARSCSLLLGVLLALLASCVPAAHADGVAARILKHAEAQGLSKFKAFTAFDGDHSRSLVSDRPCNIRREGG